MTKKEIIILALKLLGLYFIIQGLTSVSVTFGQNGYTGFDNWSLYIGVLLYFISGLILYFGSDLISEHILSSDEIVITELNISENLQAVIYRIVGVCITVFAIPGLVHLVGQIIQVKIYGSELPHYIRESPSYIIPLISQFVYFLLGVFLALGPGSVIKLLGRFDKTIEKMNT